MAVINRSQPYPDARPVDGGEEANDRALRHRREALDRLALDETGAALTHALLALESRLDELCWTVATR